MARFWLYLLVVFMIQDTAFGATISTASNESVVLLEGDIVDGDYAQFLNVVAEKNIKAIVLKSGGGNLKEALNIGNEISKRKIDTVIDGNDVCASACAYIWLAGNSRSAAFNSKIGFHSPYTAGEEMKISSTGNALAGAYLARLGFDDMAITFATAAAPREMRWMTASDASFLGIAVKWSGAEPHNITRPVLSIDEVRQSLLTTSTGRRLHDGVIRVFNELVDETYHQQQEGKYWKDSAKNRFFGFIESNFAEWTNFEDSLWATASRETLIDLANFNISVAKKMLKNNKPQACLFMMGRYDVTENKFQMMAEIARIEGYEFTEKKGDLIVKALEETPLSIKPLKSKEKKNLSRRLLEISRTMPEYFSTKEIKVINSVLGGGKIKKSDHALLCRYYVIVSEQLMKKPDEFVSVYRHAYEL